MASEQEARSAAPAPRSASDETPGQGRPGRPQERHELCATTTEGEAAETIADAVHEARFALTEAVAYHAAREIALARLNRLLTGTQIFLGTGAIAALTPTVPFGPVIPLILSALAGVVQLVVDPAGAARDHRALRSRLHQMVADLAETESLEQCRRARAALQRVAADSPPAYRAAQALAYNTAVLAMYPANEAMPHLYKVGFWRRLTANWLPMRGHIFVRN